MKKYLKIFALLLALVMVLSTFASCGKDSENTDGEASDGESVDTSKIEDGPTSAWKDSALEARNYDGEVFVIRYPTDTTFIPDTFDVKPDEASKNIVKKAGYDRDKVFEELTGALISYRPVETDPNRGTDVADIRVLSSSGDLSDVNMLCTGARAMGTLISESLLLDLNQYDNYIKSDKYWYSSGVNNQMGIGGKLFALAGFNTTLNYRYMQTIVVNNTELSNHYNNDQKIEEIYSIVLENKWTMEKLFEYGANYSATVSDLGNDPTQDKFTFIVSVNSVQGLFHGLGGTVVEKNANDIPTVTITNSKNQNDLLPYLRGKLIRNSDVYLAPNDTEGSAFQNGKSLFSQYPLSGFSQLGDFGIEGRVLPLPLYAEGEAYVSNMMPWCTSLAAIPAICDDADMSAYCIEAYMTLSYDYVYPEFYERIFKTRYAENLTESSMFDLITGSAYIDCVETYQWQNDNTAIRKILTDESTEIGSAVEGIYDVTNTKLQEFFKTYNFG